MNSIQEVYDTLGNDFLTSFSRSQCTTALADSGRMTSNDLWSTEGLSAILCLPSTGLRFKVPRSVNLNYLPGHIFLEMSPRPYPPVSVFLSISSLRCLPGEGQGFLLRSLDWLQHTCCFPSKSKVIFVRRL